MSYLYPAQLGSAVYSGNMTAAAEAPINALDQHEKSLDALAAHLESLCHRAGALADRLFGSVPEPVSQAEKSPTSPPAIRRLDDLASAAHARLESLTKYISRLEQL